MADATFSVDDFTFAAIILNAILLCVMALAMLFAERIDRFAARWSGRHNKPRVPSRRPADLIGSEPESSMYGHSFRLGRRILWCRTSIGLRCRQ
jgi:hypothetical protein